MWVFFSMQTRAETERLHLPMLVRDPKRSHSQTSFIENTLYSHMVKLLIRQWTAETHCPRAWQQTQNCFKKGFDEFKDNSSITGLCPGRTCENLPASLAAGRVLESMDKSVGSHKIAASFIVVKNVLLALVPHNYSEKPVWPELCVWVGESHCSTV